MNEAEIHWIAATYTDEEEIRLRGQQIIYMLHDEVGHLGIFVSSKVARKEHAEMASTLETVEAVAPGLYERVIENTKGEGQDKQLEVRVHDRTLKALPEVEAALARMKQGGLPEAVIRLLLLLAASNQSFRAEILHRWAQVFKYEAPLKDLTVENRQRMLREQSVIVTFDEQGAIGTLPGLLPLASGRKQAVDLLKRIVGDIPDPSPELVEMAQALYDTLDLAEIKQKTDTRPKPRGRRPAAANKAKRK